MVDIAEVLESLDKAIDEGYSIFVTPDEIFAAPVNSDGPDGEPVQTWGTHLVLLAMFDYLGYSEHSFVSQEFSEKVGYSGD